MSMLDIKIKSIDWSRTRSSEYPFECSIDGHHYQIRINDFPNEPMYTLLIDQKEIEHFDDWPQSWKKP